MSAHPHAIAATPRQASAEPMVAWLAALLPFLPVLLLRVIPDIGAMTASAKDAVHAGAIHAGLFAYVGFAVGLVLGARLPRVERLYGGLDRMYRFHRRLGMTVAGLLLVHLALLLLSAWIADDTSIAALLRPDPGLRSFSGVVALGTLLAVLALTRIAKLRHETFLRVHRVLGVAFALGAAHALRMPAFAQQSRWLNGYLVLVTVVGVLAWGYRSGLGRTLVRRHFYEVADVRPLHPTVTELTLTPLEEPLAFAPGQLVFVGIDDDAVSRELHPFSITSAPSNPTLRLVIKAAGDFTTDLQAVTPGSTCRIEGPYGSFWQRGSTAARQIWIAGGIGVTPFLSMAHSLADDDHGTIDLYYCVKDADSAVLVDELHAVADRHPDLRVIVVPEDTQGFLTAERIRETSGDLSRAHVFLCGPAPMIDALVAQLTGLGVAPERLHHEDFRLRGRGAGPTTRRTRAWAR